MVVLLLVLGVVYLIARAAHEARFYAPVLPPMAEPTVDEARAAIQARRLRERR